MCYYLIVVAFLYILSSCYHYVVLELSHECPEPVAALDHFHRGIFFVLIVNREVDLNDLRPVITSNLSEKKSSFDQRLIICGLRANHGRAIIYNTPICTIHI